MRIRILIILLSIFMGGCAGLSTPPEPSPGEVLPAAESEKTEATLIVEPPTIESPVEPSETEEEPEPIPMGLVFAKTQFEGVTKTSYVQLSMIDLSAPEKEYKLIIGDKANHQGWPWKVQTVNPGYFYIELPVGQYRIFSIAIPVGTTQAAEPIDIIFNVKADRVVYLGTLKIVGTKERIKLGGVPVIRPGFEYTAEIIDEREEAVVEFNNQFDGIKENVEFQLMQLHPLAETQDDETN